MDKCYYHPKTASVTMCIGCKMPVCQTCASEGKRGFCEYCMKKVAQVSEKVADIKKTGVVGAAQKVTVSKSSATPPSGRNAKACFHHPELKASTNCPTCNRAFCPACLNSQGLCSHCATREREEADLARARAMPAAPRGAAAWLQPKRLLIGAGGLVGAMILLGVLRHPAPVRTASTSETIAKIHSSDLTAAEKAQLAMLHRQAERAQSLATVPPGGDMGGAAGGSQAFGGEAPRAAAPAGGGYSAPAVEGPIRLALVAPGAGSLVRGGALVRARVSGRPSRVELLVDGDSRSVTNAPPFQFDWDSRSVGNGRHTLTVAAFDGADRQRASASVSVQVSN
jgi:hypothetical protein